MRSIKARFIKEQSKQPFLSDTQNYIRAIQYQGFNHRSIREKYIELVDEEDYDKEILSSVINHLYQFS